MSDAPTQNILVWSGEEGRLVPKLEGRRWRSVHGVGPQPEGGARVYVGLLENFNVFPLTVSGGGGDAAGVWALERTNRVIDH